jgi:hypothetical protein
MNRQAELDRVDMNNWPEAVIEAGMMIAATALYFGDDPTVEQKEEIVRCKSCELGILERVDAMQANLHREMLRVANENGKKFRQRLEASPA